MQETMSEVTTKRYQWKKGDDFGKLVTVESVDSKFTNFTDGTKIFSNILTEFLEEVVNGVIPFPQVKSVGQSPIVPTVTQTEVAVKTIVQKESPLLSLIEKLSKKNIAPLPVNLNLNIPNKAVFTMLIENADENREELIKTIAKVAVSQIEINKLQEYLTEEITNYVNNYYNE